MLLKDKKTIVTGAANGIGQAIFQVFVKNGASVLITDKSQHLEEVAKTIKGYGEIKSAIGDICHDNHLMNLIKTCRKDWGGLDVLVNNAGITLKSKLGMTTKKDTQNLFETNIRTNQNYSKPKSNFTQIIQQILNLKILKEQ